MTFVAKGLQIFGALALAALLVIVGFFAYSIYSNNDRTEIASKKETQFIFNSSGLKADQEYKVISSFQSARTFTGDHSDHFCLEISAFYPDVNNKTKWKFVPDLSRPEQDAVASAESETEAAECFKRQKTEFRNLQVYPPSVYLHHGYVTSYEVILFDAQTNRLFYKSYKS